MWLYFRFPLSFRDVEDLLAQRGIAKRVGTKCPTATENICCEPSLCRPKQACGVDQTADLQTVLGKNLKRLRTRRGYSLERLALSGLCVPSQRVTVTVPS